MFMFFNICFITSQLNPLPSALYLCVLLIFTSSPFSLMPNSVNRSGSDCNLSASIGVSFLIKESSAPQPRDPKTNQSITSTPPLGLDYYSTDKDRQEEKNRFIDLMRKKVWTSLIAATKAELEKAEQALGKIRAERAKLRVSILQKEFELRSLENEFSKTGDLSSSQADRVINNEYVFWVSADEDEILIYFYSPHLKNDRYFRNASYG